MIKSYEKYGLLFRPSAPTPWQKRDYGFDPDAMGDCLSYTADEAMKRNEVRYLRKVRYWLILRKRWPDELQKKYKQFIAKTMVGHWWSRYRWRRSKDKDGKTDRLCKYRSQTGMTRDPFVFYYAACVFHDKRHWIKDATIPFLNNRPTLRAWRRYLITQTRKDKRRYMLWEILLINQPRREFAHDLVKARCIAAGCPEIIDLLPEPIPNKG